MQKSKDFFKRTNPSSRSGESSHISSDYRMSESEYGKFSGKLVSFAFVSDSLLTYNVVSSAFCLVIPGPSLALVLGIAISSAARRLFHTFFYRL
jgi:hypothetical protein